MIGGDLVTHEGPWPVAVSSRTIRSRRPNSSTARRAGGAQMTDAGRRRRGRPEGRFYPLMNRRADRSSARRSVRKSTIHTRAHPRLPNPPAKSMPRMKHLLLASVPVVVYVYSGLMYKVLCVFFILFLWLLTCITELIKEFTHFFASKIQF